MTNSDPTRLPDAAYEAQEHLVFKKGTRVRVVKSYALFVAKLQAIYELYKNDSDAKKRAWAKDVLKEMNAFKAAVGKTRTVVDYTTGANPHGIRVKGMIIFFPKECLEAV